MSVHDVIRKYCLVLLVICCAMDEIVSGAQVQQESSDPATQNHIRRKRHISDHLITDRRMRDLQEWKRTQLLYNIAKFEGSQDLCKCKAPRNAIERRFGSREKSKRMKALQRRGCTCDRVATMRQMLKKAQHIGRSNRSEDDPFSAYLSQLDDSQKAIVRHFLQERIKRIRRLERFRKIRRRGKEERRNLLKHRSHLLFYRQHVLMS